MRTDDDTRSLEQEIAAGQSETTPFVTLGTVFVVLAVLVCAVVALAALAYALA